jgi:anaphase-promoting complex subunit 2
LSQYVLPLLSACADAPSSEDPAEVKVPMENDTTYNKHMNIVLSYVQILEGAIRLYSSGFQLLAGGIKEVLAMEEEGETPETHLMTARFQRDLRSLVGNSASDQLMHSLGAVLVQLVGATLGALPKWNQHHRTSLKMPRIAAPAADDHNSLAAKKRLLELLGPLHKVGLAGERFQILFAEVMDAMMARFVKRAYSGLWIVVSKDDHGLLKSRPALSLPDRPVADYGHVSPCIASLFDWIDGHYVPLVADVMTRINGDGIEHTVPFSDIRTYRSLAAGRLAALRITELYDIVLQWPKSRGALDDLRASITTPQRRLQLTDTFSAALEKRLLHPGRSTLEILQTYISMIRAFHALDHTKVLLGRVQPRLQLYLCGREDAIRTVVDGLLATPGEIQVVMQGRNRQKDDSAARSSDRIKGKGKQVGPFMTPAMPLSRRGNVAYRAPDDGADMGIWNSTHDTPAKTAGATNKLIELAVLLSESLKSCSPTRLEDDGDLDWDDMAWVPDPIDAGANYRRSRDEDVIGTIISSLGSPETFIREFQLILTERLLSDQPNFEQEVRVLNLLKKRFGEGALQNCDVMIRDIRESRRLDAAIRKVQAINEGAQQLGEAQAAAPATPRQRLTSSSRTRPGGSLISRVKAAQKGAEEPYHARILSRLYWPNLDREHFLLPQPIVTLQQRYETGYEQLKSARKLTWLNQLGLATVELELQDRTVTVDCKTYEATVIYAFQGPVATGPARRTVDQLVDQLQMDDDLISSALSFWVTQGVLARRGDVYIVLETDSSDGVSSSPTAVAASQPSIAEPAAPAVDEKEVAQRALYWSYIRGMLTNASATMPLGQMAMMMKMLIPDGFPWSNEELQEFLAEKVAEGEMEIVGGKYKLVRK